MNPEKPVTDQVTEWARLTRRNRPAGEMWQITETGRDTIPYAVICGRIATLHPTEDHTGWDIVIRNMFGELLKDFQGIDDADDAYRKAGATLAEMAAFEDLKRPGKSNLIGEAVMAALADYTGPITTATFADDSLMSCGDCTCCAASACSEGSCHGRPEHCPCHCG